MKIKYSILIFLITIILGLRLAFSADFQLPVVRVTDGDTFRITLPLPEPLDRASVRIKGIDTPELAPRALCVEEAEQAKKASAFLRTLITGKTVTLMNYVWDKYGRRINSDVFVDGKFLKDQILQYRDENNKPIALPYTTGRRPNWCTYLTQ